MKTVVAAFLLLSAASACSAPICERSEVSANRTPVDFDDWTTSATTQLEADLLVHDPCWPTLDGDRADYAVAIPSADSLQNAASAEACMIEESPLATAIADTATSEGALYALTLGSGGCVASVDLVGAYRDESDRLFFLVNKFEQRSQFLREVQCDLDRGADRRLVFVYGSLDESPQVDVAGFDAAQCL